MKNICLILISFALLFTGCSQKTPPGDPASLTFTLGEVTVNGEKASIGQEIRDGDKIETGEQSLARIQVGDKTLLQIKAHSELVYKLDSESIIELNRGWLSGITKGKLAKGEYKIKTPTSVAAVRGTSYCLKIESPESTYFCTCNGTIHQHAEGMEDDAEDITAAHHAGRRYLRNSDGTMSVEKAGMLYHTDNDIEEIAAVIGKTVNWDVAD